MYNILYRSSKNKYKIKKKQIYGGSNFIHNNLANNQEDWNWDDIRSNNFNLPWNWTEICRHPNITMDMIRDNLHLPWNWYEISRHPNLTMDMIRENPTITMDMILDNPHLPWVFDEICRNPNITIPYWEIIKEKIRIEMKL